VVSLLVHAAFWRIKQLLIIMRAVEGRRGPCSSLLLEWVTMQRNEIAEDGVQLSINMLKPLLTCFVLAICNALIFLAVLMISLGETPPMPWFALAFIALGVFGFFYACVQKLLNSQYLLDSKLETALRDDVDGAQLSSDRVSVSHSDDGQAADTNTVHEGSLLDNTAMNAMQLKHVPSPSENADKPTLPPWTAAPSRPSVSVRVPAALLRPPNYRRLMRPILRVFLWSLRDAGLYAVVFVGVSLCRVLTFYYPCYNVSTRISSCPLAFDIVRFIESAVVGHVRALLCNGCPLPFTSTMSDPYQPCAADVSAVLLLSDLVPSGQGRRLDRNSYADEEAVHWVQCLCDCRSGDAIRCFLWPAPPVVHRPAKHDHHILFLRL